MTNKADRPKGTISISHERAPGFSARTGSERCTWIEDGVAAYWPSNANSRAIPEHGPLPATCEKSRGGCGKKFLQFTHVVPDKDGVFVPAVYSLCPDCLAERIDERAARFEKLPASLREQIEDRRAGR